MTDFGRPCSRCGGIYPLECYRVGTRKGVPYRDSMCRACRTDYRREWRRRKEIPPRWGPSHPSRAVASIASNARLCLFHGRPHPLTERYWPVDRNGQIINTARCLTAFAQTAPPMPDLDGAASRFPNHP